MSTLGAYTVDYSPMQHPIVFFLKVTSIELMKTIDCVEFPTNSVIGILNNAALEFYQLVQVVYDDIIDNTKYVVPNDFEQNIGRAWKKIELAY